MNEKEQGPWLLDSYLDVDFDGLSEGEYLAKIPCARHRQTDERLTLSELIPRLNALERRADPILPADEARIQRIRRALYAVGIDWNAATAKLAACDWVTESYIRRHAQAADPDFLGLAIQRMLDGLPPPVPARERRHREALARYPHIRR